MKESFEETHSYSKTKDASYIIIKIKETSINCVLKYNNE